jgi:hypothetical protein
MLRRMGQDLCRESKASRRLSLRFEKKSSNMSIITDDYMQQMLHMTRPYIAVILRKTFKRDEPGADKIVWEHGRRNFELRRDGQLCVVCPVRDESDISGISIFCVNEEETKSFMDKDPAVQSGIFVYETHPTRSFPGDSLTK